MKLSLYTDYSLRVLLYLGANQHRRVALPEIAERYGISREHLRKVAHTLGTLGYIKTFRGKSGGIELRVSPEELSIGDLVAATEPRQPVIDCRTQPCILVAACSLQGVLREAENAFYEALDQYSLADLLNHRKMTDILASDH